jgi:hypothetical protein
VSNDHVAKRCSICGRFRSYETEDAFCIVCGSDALEAECGCGRAFDFSLEEAEDADLYCPRCGRSLRGRSDEFTG